MLLHSTNRNTLDVDFKTAILTGQALDKGLYMLNQIPSLSIDEIFSFRELKLSDIASTIISKLLGDSIPEKNLKLLLKRALNFPVPIQKIDQKDYICYLDKGPTCSFKDFGARSLARIVEYYLKEEDKKIIILTATSGDTGGAVAQAFYEMENINIVVLYPKKEISDLQRKQMTTLGKNVTAIGIDGKFDDCQHLVKTAFADEELKHINLSSANSINIGRLLPQSIYYFWSYSRVADKVGEKVIFSVPSGNFGNLMGGLIAKKMGLPVKKFISAVNENDEFPNFLKTGRYQKVEPSRKCISNAMNVGHPSNLARVIDLYGGQIDEKGIIHQEPNLDEMRRDIASFSITDELTKKTIGQFHQKHGGIVEPHGAVGWAALKIYRNQYPKHAKFKGISLETADPAKFPEEIVSLVGVTPKIPDSLLKIQSKKEFSNEAEIDNYSDFRRFLSKKF
ncbi:MAG: threonine synthase [Candidatus Lokiarchaeota archaeon]|nr:threonine synthase [Candidatus Lokiarchaeota archaeon]